MDAPNVPSAGNPSPEELKTRLRAELAAARGGLGLAVADLRHAMDLRSRLRAAVPDRLATTIRHHPIAVAASALVVGFWIARGLTGSFRRKSPSHKSMVGKSSGFMAKQLLFSSAALLLKPAIKEILTREITARLRGGRKP